MRIGVLGTGMVGQALASRLVETGHDVVMGSRDAANEKAAAWVAARPGRAAAGTFADAAAHGEVVLNATGGAVAIDALRLAGAENLGGKVLIDVSNPMKPDSGFPPQLDPVGDDSLAERIQREFPTARVVKTLNTMNCDVMVNPSLVPGEHDVFMAGEDASAKETVRGLLSGFGWPDASIRDVGGIAAARGLEMYLIFWIGLRVSLGHSSFNIHVVT
jgi:8-hydroxy-5-deazaflavin:NADPH oxidoreductase